MFAIVTKKLRLGWCRFCSSETCLECVLLHQILAAPNFDLCAAISNMLFAQDLVCWCPWRKRLRTLHNVAAMAKFDLTAAQMVFTAKMNTNLHDFTSSLDAHSFP